MMLWNGAAQDQVNDAPKCWYRYTRNTHKAHQFLRTGFLHKAIEPVSDPGAEQHRTGCRHRQQKHKIVIVPDKKGTDGKNEPGHQVHAVLWQAATPQNNRTESREEERDRDPQRWLLERYWRNLCHARDAIVMDEE